MARQAKGKAEREAGKGHRSMAHDLHAAPRSPGALRKPKALQRLHAHPAKSPGLCVHLGSQHQILRQGVLFTSSIRKCSQESGVGR